MTFSVACLCNLANVNRAKRAHAVAELYLGGIMKPKEDASAMNLTAEQLERLVGTYRDPRTKEVWRVSAQAGKLWVDFAGGPAELRAMTTSRWRTTPGIRA
jgi:hypothetical protein